jgi:hypothetical protein
MIAPKVIGSPLWPASGAADAGACDETPGNQATSDANSRDRKNDFSSSSPATSLTTMSPIISPPKKALKK